MILENKEKTRPFIESAWGGTVAPSDYNSY